MANFRSWDAIFPMGTRSVVSNIFGIFTPKIGEDSHVDEHILEMGWFNHQPGKSQKRYPSFSDRFLNSDRIKPRIPDFQSDTPWFPKARGFDNHSYIYIYIYIKYFCISVKLTGGTGFECVNMYNPGRMSNWIFFMSTKNDQSTGLCPSIAPKVLWMGPRSHVLIGRQSSCPEKYITTNFIRLVQSSSHTFWRGVWMVWFLGASHTSSLSVLFQNFGIQSTEMTRWWFQRFFIFTPKIGEDFQFDEHIFQMGGKKPPTREISKAIPFLFRIVFSILIV